MEIKPSSSPSNWLLPLVVQDVVVQDTLAAARWMPASLCFRFLISGKSTLSDFVCFITFMWHSKALKNLTIGFEDKHKLPLSIPTCSFNFYSQTLFLSSFYTRLNVLGNPGALVPASPQIDWCAPEIARTCTFPKPCS